ncbi:MAG: hypothetical protein P4L90_14670 [Rhodopila sp.]|nr:hypothetical protein [Rhodopila sp.]
MIETTTTLTAPAAEAPTASAIPIHPSHILLNLIVALLAPMFLSTSGGDIEFARMAALGTVNAYRVRNHADLITVAQIIACGLTALGSLSLSMADNLSLSMTLRLRGNAVALNRSADQNRRALRESRFDDRPHQAERTDGAESPPEPDQDQYEAQVTASVAAVQQRAAESRASLKDAEPSSPAPSPIAAPKAAAPMITERQRQAMWARAMADVAGEFTASLPHLPPAERRAASLRAEVLSSTANELLSGSGAPRLKSGILGRITRPNTI